MLVAAIPAPDVRSHSVGVAGVTSFQKKGNGHEREGPREDVPENVVAID